MVAIQPNEFEKKWDALKKKNPVDGHVTVEGIPFRVQGTKTEATPFEKSGDISFAISGKPGAIYLLMAAHYDGKKIQSNTDEPITNVTHVEQFIAQVEYADGSFDQIFPSRLPDGAS